MCSIMKIQMENSITLFCDISMREEGDRGSTFYVTHGTKEREVCIGESKKYSGESSGLWISCLPDIKACFWHMVLWSVCQESWWCCWVHNPPANCRKCRDVDSILVRNWQRTPAFLPGQLWTEESGGL